MVLKIYKRLRAVLAVFLVLTMLLPDALAATPSNIVINWPKGSDNRAAEMDIPLTSPVDESSRDISELKALNSVVEDESGTVVRVKHDSDKPLTSEELELLFQQPTNMTGPAVPSAQTTDSKSSYSTPFALSDEDVARGIYLHGNENAFQREMGYLALANESTPFPAEVLSDLLVLVCSGYSSGQAYAAFACRNILGLSVSELAEAQAKTLEQEFDRNEQRLTDSELSSEPEYDEVYSDLSIKMGVPYCVIEDFMKQFTGSLQDLESQISTAYAETFGYEQEKGTELNPDDGNVSLSVQSTDPEYFYAPEEILSKPYTYSQIGSIDVNMNTGAYTYSETDLSLPGINGLDLNITRSYDSSTSYAETAIGWYNPNYANNASLRVQYDWYLVGSRGNLTLISNRSAYTFKYQPNASIANWHQDLNASQYLDAQYWMEFAEEDSCYVGAWDINEEDVIILFVPAVAPVGTQIGLALVNEKIDYHYQVKEFGLGHGWRLGFSAIETYITTNNELSDIAAKRRLITSDGKRYEIEEDIYTGSSNLVDYPLDDMRLEPANGAYPGAQYVLTYKDGKKEYFDSSGRNIAIVDRFGNTITIAYTVTDQGAVSKIQIRDTIGNVIVYQNENIDPAVTQYVAGKKSVTWRYNTKWTLALNGTVLKTYYSFDQTSTSLKMQTLTAVQDEMGEITHYTTSTGTRKFNCYFSSAQTGDNSVRYAWLQEISYANGLSQSIMGESGAYDIERLGIAGYRTRPRANSVGYEYEYESETGTETGKVLTQKYSFGDYSRYFFPTDTYTASSKVRFDKSLGNTTYAWPGQETIYVFNRKSLKESVEEKAYTPLQDELITSPEVAMSIEYSALGTLRRSEFSYNNLDLPSSITTTSYDLGTQTGMVQSHRYTYNNTGNVLTETLPNNQTTTYTYDSRYQLPKTATYKKDADTTIIKKNVLTEDGKNIDRTETTENGVLVNKTQYSYNPNGNGTVLSIKQYKNEVENVEQQFVYGPTGQVTESKFLNVKDVNGSLVQGSPSYPAGVLAKKTTYNTRGWPRTQTDESGNQTNISYDAVGRITNVTNPDNTSSSYHYDVPQNKVTYTDVLGTQYLYRYDKLGNLLQVVDVLSGQPLKTNAYDSKSRLILSTEHSSAGEDKVTYFYYDDYDRMIEMGIRRPNGAVTYKESYQYLDGSGKIITTVHGDTNAPSIVTAKYSDNMGNTIKTGRILNGVENVDTYNYDYLGNCIQSRSAYTASLGGAYTSKATYDWAGRVLTSTNALNQTTSQTYDWLGNPLTGTDAKSNTTTNKYDEMGRLLKTVAPLDNDGVGGALRQREVQYSYAQNGNLIQTKVLRDVGIYATTQYTYDSLNRLVMSNLDGMYTQYFYHAAGQPLRMYTGLSSPLVITGLDQVTSTGDDDYSVTRYTYDRFGNLTTLTDPLGQSEQYDYDLNGNMTSKVDRNNATTTYSYDNQGRQTHTQAGSDYLSQSYTLTGQVLSSGNGSKTTAYQYDSLGRLKSETTGTEVKTYNYNLADQRTGFTLTMGGVQQLNNIYGYDALGRMNSFNGGGVTANYDYDANGNRRYVSYGNGLREEYTYNNANLVTQVTNQRGSTVLSQYNYTYYLDGNQSGKSDHLGLVTSYQYNPQGALKSEREQRSGTLVQEYSYQYDDYNNRTRLTAAGAKSFTTDYTYDKNNRLRQETKIEGDTTYLVDYQYDPNGNMYSALHSLLTSVTGSPSMKVTLSESLDGVTLYEYDGFNRQVGVKTAGTTASYSYLPNGLRESTTVNGTATDFVWDGDQTVLTTTGSVNTKYLRGMNLIASQGSGTSYYLYNAHGDVVQLTSSTGTVTTEYDYDAFGNEQTPSANDQNPFRYCGEYLDNETDTYYLRARYYNPAAGRFLAEDSARAGLNWYAYCSNNPANLIDPSGMADQYVETGGVALPPLYIDGALNPESNLYFIQYIYRRPVPAHYTAEFYSYVCELQRFRVRNYPNEYNDIQIFIIENQETIDTLGYMTSTVLDGYYLQQYLLDHPELQAAAKGAGSSTTRVGRWMSVAEYNKMVETGKVQMSPNGNTTYVANPANPNAFKAASSGSVYVEFDVPTGSIAPAGNENWGQIPGPGSLMDRLYQSKGLPPINGMPDATNIKISGR
jgi:RHS repeat-associated protein